MITEYEIRVIRPWAPGMKKGETLMVNARRRVQLVRGGFAELVERANAKAAAESVKPARKIAAKKNQ